MNITYEYATENDAYGIEFVAANSWKETYTGLLPDEYLDYRVNNVENRIEKTKEFLKNYTGKYIVAKNNDKVIGILCFSDSLDEEYKEYGYLEALYVLKKYQGYGIGKELFKIAVIGLKEMGYSKMKLECMSGNDTINFYKKYSGTIKSQIDYPINHVGTVKADIVLFEDLDNVLELIKEKINRK